MSVEFVNPPVEMTSPISSLMATDAEYRELRDALLGKPATGNQSVIINTYGEGIPYLNLGDVISLIASGVIWVDYCGWPMWGIPAGKPTNLVGSDKPYYPAFSSDGHRFSEFLQAIGKPLTAIPYDETGVVFDPHYIFYLERRWSSSEYPWDRGMVVDTDIINSGFYVPDPIATKIPLGQKKLDYYVSGQLVSKTVFCYSCFGVRYERGGYFYANRGNPGGFNFTGMEGIAPAIYASAIAEGIGKLGIAGGGGGGGGGGTVPPPPGGGVAYSASSCPVLRTGASGETVRALQQALNTLINAGLPVTGYYGSLTTQAVQSFQQSAGLIIDGVAGCQTYGALDQALRASGLGYFSCGNCSQTQPPPGGGGGDGGGGIIPTPSPQQPPYLEMATIALLAGLGGYLLMRGLQQR